MDKDTVKKIAGLSRLFIEDDEAEGLAREFGEVLEMFEKLDELECNGWMVLPVNIETKPRDDEPKVFDEGLSGYDNGFYRGPRTVE